MPADYLHNHPGFFALIRIVANERGIDPALVEKDYWITHCLYGLRQLDLTFELKGGTSLSKGFQIINRFSEDIDIRIEPPPGHDVKIGHNQTKPAHVQSRRNFYDWLATTIRIDGIEKVERGTDFDNKDLGRRRCARNPRRQTPEPIAARRAHSRRWIPPHSTLQPPQWSPNSRPSRCRVFKGRSWILGPMMSISTQNPEMHARATTTSLLVARSDLSAFAHVPILTGPFPDWRTGAWFKKGRSPGLRPAR
jgi:hypothetical protein